MGCLNHPPLPLKAPCTAGGIARNEHPSFAFCGSFACCSNSFMLTCLLTRHGNDVIRYNWWSEASTGVANEIEGRGKNTSTTKFAFPITTGMSFNRTLWLLTGQCV